MKIEVTFDRSARKEFREQCIKRLQNFVSQIKGRQAVIDNGCNANITQCQESRNSTFRQHTLLIREQENSIARHSARENKMLKKVTGLENGEKQTQPCTPKESSKQIMPPKPIQMNKKVSQAFNIQEMRDNVNKLLLKLEKNTDLQQSNQDSMEEKMHLTNRKLDYIIQCIQTKKTTQTPQNRSNFHPKQQQSRQDSSFQHKFDKLVRRYYQIKEKGSGSATQSTKQISSLQQTQDSVAFRYVRP